MNHSSHFIESNGIRLHYLEYNGEGPTLILMHGLTANAHAFGGLVAAGLDQHAHVISVDLRGRGLTDAPSDYSLSEHAKDIIGLLDHLQIEDAIIGGHSFGGLLTFYLAYYYPSRVHKMILMDVAARLHINTRKMLEPAMSRLGQTFPSFHDYLEKVKHAPYNTFWEHAMQEYYKADVKENEDGSVIPRSSVRNIGEAARNVLSEPWRTYIKNMPKPAILFNATGIYTLNAPLLPKENALQTVKLMRNCEYVEVEGNHQTMLYGKGAMQIVEGASAFIK